MSQISNKTADAIDLLIKYSTDARWDIISKYMRILELEYLRRELFYQTKEEIKEHGLRL